MVFPRLKNRWFIGILTTLLSTLLLLWCFHNVHWGSFWVSIRSIKPGFLLFSFLVSFLLIWAKTIQILIYLPKNKKVPFIRLFEVVSILLMTVSILPFWGGHALFVYLLGEKEKVGKTVTLSIVTQDQILDGFGKIFIISWAILVLPLPPWMRDGFWGIISAVVIAFMAAFFLAHRYRTFTDLSGQSQGKMGKIKNLFGKWAHHMVVMRDIKKLFPIIFLAAFKRVLEAFVVFGVQKSFSLDLGFSVAVVVVAAISLATLLPLSPGRVGLFEAAVYLIYVQFGVEPSVAMALALFIHLAHSLPFVFTGYFVSIKTGFRGAFSRKVREEALNFVPAES